MLICVVPCRAEHRRQTLRRRHRVVRDPSRVIFGETLYPAPSIAPAAWLSDACSVRPWTVDGLIPNQYEAVVRLHPPEPEPVGWWQQYRDLFDTVASIGALHTSTPELGWFAVWEGHGFGVSSGKMGWRHPPGDEAERRQRELLLEHHRNAARERNARIGPALAAVPLFELPDRNYYLLNGPLAALVGLRYPDDDDWKNPDLFWPDDRSWFAATDVECWSLYVGGTEPFVTELGCRVTTPWEFVDRSERLPIEH